jgi:hypothetical protein
MYEHASNGPDFVTDLSRIVKLLRLIALASSIWHDCAKGPLNQLSCLLRILAVLCGSICGFGTEEPKSVLR